MTDRNKLERLLAVDAKAHGLKGSMAATLALGIYLRNNAHHYLSLMDEVERLRGAVAKIGAIAAKPTYPGNNLRDIHLIARQALGETHDN